MAEVATFYEEAEVVTSLQFGEEKVMGMYSRFTKSCGWLMRKMLVKVLFTKSH